MWPWRSPWPLGSRARSMHIPSLLFDLSIHTSVNSWLSHFKFSIVVVEKRNFRLKRYYVINIFKLEYLRYLLSVWDQTYFGKSRIKVSFISLELLFKVTSGVEDMTSLSFLIADISLLLRSIKSQFGHSGQGSPCFHIKYYVTLKVTLTFGVNGKVIAYSFFYCLVCPFIPPSFLDRYSSNYQLWSLTKELPVG